MRFSIVIGLHAILVFRLGADTRLVAGRRLTGFDLNVQ